QLLERLGAAHPESNLLLSPYSLALSLALAYNGAAGQTRQEEARTLGGEQASVEEVKQGFRALRTTFDQRRSEGELSIANGVWTDSRLPLSPDFLQRLQEFYAAVAQTLDSGDPGAADRINQWVSSTTRGRIEALLRREDLASGIGCILTNAIYFKG